MIYNNKVLSAPKRRAAVVAVITDYGALDGELVIMIDEAGSTADYWRVAQGSFGEILRHGQMKMRLGEGEKYAGPLWIVRQYQERGARAPKPQVTLRKAAAAEEGDDSAEEGEIREGGDAVQRAVSPLAGRPAVELEWADLSERQKVAATSLGLSETLWRTRCGPDSGLPKELTAQPRGVEQPVAQLEPTPVAAGESSSSAPSVETVSAACQTTVVAYFDLPQEEAPREPPPPPESQIVLEPDSGLPKELMTQLHGVDQSRKRLVAQLKQAYLQRLHAQHGTKELEQQRALGKVDAGQHAEKMAIRGQHEGAVAQLVQGIADARSIPDQLAESSVPYELRQNVIGKCRAIPTAT